MAALSTRAPEEVSGVRARLRPNGLKRCRVCADWKPLAAFPVNAPAADGLRRHFRPCCSVAAMRRKRRDAEKAWQPLGMPVEVCFYCGAATEDSDHVKPRSLGGTDEGNVLLACGSCNRSKGRTSLVWWAERRFGPNAADVLYRVLPCCRTSNYLPADLTCERNGPA